jgi:SPX domain protein involved in polyphosphate accumulation
VDGSSILDYRYERKFVINYLTNKQLEYIVKSSPLFFSELYCSRYINNIYYDSIILDSYFDNVEGLSSRSKCRIRWYGDKFGEVNNSFLEIKSKVGPLGTKVKYSLKPFILGSNRHYNLQELIEKHNEPIIHYVKFIRPILINRYKRQYYQSANCNYRITIDTNISYSKISNLNDNHLIQKNDNMIILEIKYSNLDCEDIDKVINSFPFRLNKNSKYINGMNLLHNF